MKTESEIITFVKLECIKAAQEGFYDAKLSGLCDDGAIEAAISAIQLLKTKEIQMKLNMNRINE